MSVMVVEDEPGLARVVGVVVQQRRHRRRHAARHDEQREQRETAAVAKDPNHSISSVTSRTREVKSQKGR